ncbi:MAG: fumarylacetoacetate hydrolase family protein [Pseudomonadota bacterium]
MDFVITPPDRPVLVVLGTDRRFPISRIFCIGRNYGAHAREMGHDPDREPPFFFQKSADCADQTGVFPYPPGTEDVHHEIELVACLGRGGREIRAEDAADHVFGYAVGIDMTRRDLQAEMKAAGRPWEIGKSFDSAAPMGPVHPVSEVGHPTRGRIALLVNGTTRQSGDLDQMIWPLAQQIAHLSALQTLQAGDLVFSGTPAGVGPVQRGDTLIAEVDGLAPLTVSVG